MSVVAKTDFQGRVYRTTDHQSIHFLYKNMFYFCHLTQNSITKQIKAVRRKKTEKTEIRKIKNKILYLGFVTLGLIEEQAQSFKNEKKKNRRKLVKTHFKIMLKYEKKNQLTCSF